MVIGIVSGRGRRDVTHRDLWTIGLASQGSAGAGPHNAVFSSKRKGCSLTPIFRDHPYTGSAKLSLQLFPAHVLQLVFESSGDEEGDG